MGKLATTTFVLGVGRSGTTLLRVMLAGHSKVFAPPEMFLSTFEDMKDRARFVEQRYWLKGGLRRALMDLQGQDIEEAKAAVDALEPKRVLDVYRWIQGQLGERMLIDKGPVLSYMPEWLPRIEESFESPRYVWIVRHPGAVIRSFQNMPMAEMMFQGLDIEYRNLWFEGNRNLRSFLETVDRERWTMIRYEDLVTEPEVAMRKVLTAMGLAFEEAVLHPYDGDRMREGPKGARAIGDPNMAGRKRIRPEMAKKWLSNFDPRSVGEDTRQLALELGYDLASMPLPPIARVSDAMRELWKKAEEIERRISLPMDLDDVEGRRFLLRMVSASVDTFVEQGDFDRPCFHHAESPYRKMFADCPDADYLRAPIRLDEGRVYRLTGRIPPGSLYVGVLLYGRGGRVARCLHDTQLGCDAEGRFYLLVGSEPQDGIWLRGDGDETSVMVRQYFRDRKTKERVELELELVGELPTPRPLDASVLACQVELAGRMISSVFERTVAAYERVRAASTNHFVEIPVGELFPTPDNRYLVTWFRFGPDQVLVIRGRLPAARYFGLSLCNAWMESYDYLRHTVHLNHHQLQTDEEGRFEVVLAHRDPGCANWLDTAGHSAGYLIARFLLPERELPMLETQAMYEKEFEQHRSDS